MMICILGMDRPMVDLRLPKLPILIAVFWTVMSGRQFQTFIPAVSEERTIPVRFGLLPFIPLFFPVDAGILDPLTIADNHFPSAAATCLIGSEM